MRRLAGIVATLLMGAGATVAALAASGGGDATGGTRGAAPGRVVSMNLCTDQLAMLVAAPGQLISVSHLAQDPGASAMAAEARRYHANRGLAEDIVLLRPDLVLAGQFGAGPTVALLKRLGRPVRIFAAESDIEGIRANLRRMGDVLGQPARAARVIARFDADLAALSLPAGQSVRTRAALYAENGYSAGDRTLAGSILSAAGFANVATELGLPQGGMIPLESLLLAAPDLVVLSREARGASRAGEVLDHPALRRLAPGGGGTAGLHAADWACGTPAIVNAIARMAALRDGE